jgi:hypothetical protein
MKLPECLILAGPSEHPREGHELLNNLFVATWGVPRDTSERAQIPDRIQRGNISNTEILRHST